MDTETQNRIDQLYADMKPLMDYFGIKPMTIEERYQRYLKKQEDKEKLQQLIKAIPKPKFKLPKL